MAFSESEEEGDIDEEYSDEDKDSLGRNGFNGNQDDSYFGNSGYKRYNSDSEYVSRSEGDDEEDYYQEDISSDSYKSESEIYISHSNKKGKKRNKKDNFDKKHFQ